MDMDPEAGRSLEGFGHQGSRTRCVMSRASKREGRALCKEVLLENH